MDVRWKGNNYVPPTCKLVSCITHGHYTFCRKTFFEIFGNSFFHKILIFQHFEKCGTLSTTIVDKNASHFCDNEVGGAQEKEEDNETSVTASTPGSILDSLIFEQDEELQKTEAETQSSDSTKMVKIADFITQRNNLILVKKSPFKSRPRPPMALKSDGSSLPSKCESEPRRNRQKATEGGAAATPSCRRPDTFRNR